MSSSPSTAFHLLDVRIQRFVWAEGWASLREAQEAAIPHVLKADRDLIIAAATAAGKTEAAFLPALTHLLSMQPMGLITYISPLKALINDQFGRLDRMCEHLDIPVWPWHGDVSASHKTRFLSKRHGVLLITPESLEALLCNRGSSISAVFQHISFFVVDELHAFIGSERGKQLQSLMHRIERAVGRTIPRIGLSATLGDMRLAADFLRPGRGQEVALVDSKSEGSELRVLIKGYEEPAAVKPARGDDEHEPITPAQIAAHLFKVLRGSNNLVFPNSRREVERYTNLLNRLCEEQRVPNEFWPHHGSLSKELRAETELALKQKTQPATAICTNTLELGIDIGAVKSVVQINTPPSVASVRQRLGRSGRRPGEPAILRGYCVEDALSNNASLDTLLRLTTVQTTAMVQLLLESWFEPPVTSGLHLSTLVQQILSFIAQNGGASIGELYSLYCVPAAPFSGVSKSDFASLVRHMGSNDLLVQDSAGTLLHGKLGERFVNHYSFYAAFASDEEYRLLNGSKPLGTIPVSMMLTIGQRILFAGKTWLVQEIDDAQKVIVVARTSGGVPPMFSGGLGRTHTRVRQQMRHLLESGDEPIFLDPAAKTHLAEGRQAYGRLNLANELVVDQGRSVVLLTWLGDPANEAIACLLRFRGLTAMPSGPGVEVQKEQHNVQHILNALIDASGRLPTPEELLQDASNLCREKWDWALPEPLLRRSYVQSQLALDEAAEWALKLSSD